MTKRPLQNRAASLVAASTLLLATNILQPPSLLGPDWTDVSIFDQSAFGQTLSPEEPPSTTQQQPSKSIDQYIDQIRGGSFMQRERAASELFQLGPSIVGSLRSRIDRETDTETVMRLTDVAGKLQRQNETAMENRFLVGLDVKLPGWLWFSSIMGDNIATRQLFVGIRRERPQATAMLDGTSQDRAKVLQDSVEAITSRRFNGRIGLSDADLLGVLLPIADSQVPCNQLVDRLILTLHLSEPSSRMLANNAVRDGLLDLFSRWIERVEPVSYEYALIVGQQFRLPASLELARRVLESEVVFDKPLGFPQPQNQIMAAAAAGGTLRVAMQILAVDGNPGDEEVATDGDVALLTKWLDDVRQASVRSARGDFVYWANLGDCAAAAIVALNRWRPSEVGMSEYGISSSFGFLPDQIGFPEGDETERQKSRDQIRERLKL